MIHGSAAFEDAILGSHEGTVRASAWVNGARVASNLTVAAANIQDSGNQFVRRTGSVTLVGADAMSVLSDPAVVVRLEAGCLIGGRAETVPVIAGVASSAVVDDTAGTVTLQLNDLGQRLIRDKYPKPRQSIKGATVVGQITAIINETLPWVQVIDQTGDMSTVPATAWSDRQTAITELGISIGAEVFCQADGSWLIRRVKDWSSTADYVCRDSVNLVRIARTLNFESAFNYVIASSQRADGSTILAVSQDTDPSSPTFVGRMGRLVGTVQSGLFVTQAQAQQAAYSARLRVAGYAVSTSLTSTVHPGLASGDRLKVHHTNMTTGARDFYDLVIDSISYDLMGASMDITGRATTQPTANVS